MGSDGCCWQRWDQLMMVHWSSSWSMMRHCVRWMHVAGWDVQCLGSVESDLVVGCFCGIERVLSVRSTWLWALCGRSSLLCQHGFWSGLLYFILVIGGCNSHLLGEVCVLWIVFQECLRQGLWKTMLTGCPAVQTLMTGHALSPELLPSREMVYCLVFQQFKNSLPVELCCIHCDYSVQEHSLFEMLSGIPKNSPADTVTVCSSIFGS